MTVTDNSVDQINKAILQLQSQLASLKLQVNKLEAKIASSNQVNKG